MATERLRFAVFGGPRVWRDGVELDLGPPQRRQLLTLLMLAAGDAVGLDVILDVLWADDPPESALNVVHRHVGQLRRLLEPELSSRQSGSYVAAAGTGYRLLVTAESFDLLELRRLLPDRDRASVERSLEVASGRAGAGLTPGTTMEALLASAEADRVAAGLAAGALVAGLGDVQEARLLEPAMQAIAHDHPFDEPLQAALVRTLVAAGRRADALAHFSAVRALMLDELGLEPGPELQGAQREALAEPEPTAAPDGAADVGPAARSTVPRPAQLPVHTVAVVGRGAELDRLEARLRNVDGPTVCAVTGMGGVGKTAVALQCAQQVLDAFPDGQLYANLHGYDEQAGPSDPADVLRSFLVTLGADPAALPVGAEDRGSLFRSTVADQRLLVLLDNARDSAQVRPLLPGGRGCRVLVTSRRRLDELVAVGAYAEPLGRLAPEDGLDLLSARLGQARVDAEPVGASALVDACLGLPLALSVVAAQATRYRDVSLAELADRLPEPSATLNALSGGAPATDLRRVLSLSYAALSEPAALLFRCVGVHPGRDLSLLVAASLAGLDTAAARVALDELARASLLDEVAPSRFQVHDLVKAYGYEQLTGAESDSALRRLVAHYVGTVRNAYLQYGRPPVVPVPPAPQGVTPETFRNAGESVAWYLRERATLAVLVDRAAGRGLTVECALLVLDARPMAQFWAAAGELAPVTRTALTALTADPGAAVEPAEPWRRVLEAELRRDLGMLVYRTGAGEEGLAEVQRALAVFEELGDLAGQANTLRNLSSAAIHAGDLAGAVTLASQGVALARQLGDEAAVGTALSAMVEALVAAGRYAEGVQAGEAALELCRRHGVRMGESNLVNQLAAARAGLGDFRGAIEVVSDYRALTRALGLGSGTMDTWQTLLEAEFQYATGDQEAALASYRDYLERASVSPVTVTLAGFRPTDVELGDRERVEARVAELEAESRFV
jgi:DNA-binding SARP family transcriptional activator/tetratricopeptide (TPR) repeat protein